MHSIPTAPREDPSPPNEIPGTIPHPARDPIPDQPIDPGVPVPPDPFTNPAASPADPARRRLSGT